MDKENAQAGRYFIYDVDSKYEQEQKQMEDQLRNERQNKERENKQEK